MPKPDTAAGTYREVARAKLAGILGERRAEELLSTLVDSRDRRLDTPDDLVRFADEVAALGGMEGAVGAMLGLHAVMNGARRVAAPERMHVDRSLIGTDSSVAFLAAIDESLRGSTSMEEAAQRLATLVHKRYTTVPLCRCCAVVPLRQLPVLEAAFARRFAATHGDSADLQPETPVLVLLGTSGALPAWCERRMSRGHLAIPLMSSQFVRSAPMIAAMLSALGIDLSRFDSSGVFVRRFTGGLDGVFYAPADATDEAGRLVIPAVDFVREHQIHTVLGMGSAFLDSSLAVTIVFTQERLAREEVDRLARVTQIFKQHTRALVAAGRVFARVPGGR